MLLPLLLNNLLSEVIEATLTLFGRFRDPGTRMEFSDPGTRMVFADPSTRMTISEPEPEHG